MSDADDSDSRAGGAAAFVLLLVPFLVMAIVLWLLWPALVRAQSSMIGDATIVPQKLYDTPSEALKHCRSGEGLVSIGEQYGCAPMDGRKHQRECPPGSEPALFAEDLLHDGFSSWSCAIRVPR